MRWLWPPRFLADVKAKCKSTALYSFVRLPLLCVPQHEEHTCGLCAATVVYHYYGLYCNHLRDGLCTDDKIMVIPGTDGVLPHQMVRMLSSDGFEMTGASFNHGSLAAAERNLRAGHPGLMLIDAFDAPHWVVLGGYGKNYILYMDSLCGWVAMLKSEAFDRVHGIWRLKYDGKCRLTLGLAGWRPLLENAIV